MGPSHTLVEAGALTHCSEGFDCHLKHYYYLASHKTSFMFLYVPPSSACCPRSLLCFSSPLVPCKSMEHPIRSY
mgnify:CR=1 FL=1